MISATLTKLIPMQRPISPPEMENQVILDVVTLRNYFVFRFFFLMSLILHFVSFFFFFACVGKPGDPGHRHISFVLCHIWISDVTSIKADLIIFAST